MDHDFSKLAESCELDRRAIEALGTGLAGSGKLLIVATEEDVPPSGAHGMPRVSEQTALSMIGRGVCATVVRMPQVHDRAKQGFATYLLAHAREQGVSAYVGEGSNQWPTVHRLDAARLYGHVLERESAGQCYHAVAEQSVPVRDIAEATGRRLNMPVVSLSAEESANHFGWLDRVARMDVPASNAATQEHLGWAPKERSGVLDDLGGVYSPVIDMAVPG